MGISPRAQHEIEHGKKLASSDAEHIWGWGSPAGRVRAVRRAKLIATAAGLHAGMRVLEIGCGTGLFTTHFAQSGAELVALDISQDLLEIARKQGLPENVSLICTPFEALSSDKPFDAVIGSSILHHLEIKPALAHIYRLLKPYGVMSFAEPNMLNPQIMVQTNVPWIRARMGVSPDETAFFRWQLVQMMQKVGFEQVSVIPRDWLHPSIPLAMIAFVQKLGLLFEKTPLLREIAGSLYISGRRPL